jgi:ATP-binding cassette, subfamily B, bacterial
MSLPAPGRSDPFRSALRFTFIHWARQLRTVLGVALVVIGSTMADVLIPLFAGKLVDAVAQASSEHAAAVEEALSALAVILGLGLAALTFRHIAFVGVTAMTLRVMVDVAQEGFARIQRFSTDWHANNFAGSTVRKLTRGMWALDQLHDTILIALLPSVVVLLGTTLLLGLRWPILGAIVLAGSILFVGLTITLSLGYVSPAARLANGWDTRMGGALADAISCNGVVKAFGAETREEARLARVLAKWGNRTRRAWIRGTTAGTAQNIALLLLRAAVMGGGVLMWVRGQASAGDVAFVLTSYTVVQGYLRDVGMHIHNLQRSVNDMEELVALSAMPLGVADRPDARTIAIAGGLISFERVTFHYGQHAEPLYRDLTVRIAAGEKVGLVGRSGSGKTTFVKLVQRLYDVTGGRILIDGQDISHATQASLRAQIAIVQQEPLLFHRSLAENIAYGRPGAGMAEIEAAARLANAHDFIKRLSNGYGTLVGERGVKLSGGERQRIALARAFLADAPVMILDEATSSLDSESEALIQEAMDRLMVGRTTIVVAHRLSTVRAMDRILVFDRGKVAEEGSHGDLVRRESGIYRALFERQALELASGIAA